MKALSIQQPWAYAILHLNKDDVYTKSGLLIKTKLKDLTDEQIVYFINNEYSQS